MTDLRAPMARAEAGPTAARWTALAANAPRLTWRRRARRGLAAALGVVGVLWTAAIVRYAVGAPSPFALALTALHVGALLLALAPALHRRPTDPAGALPALADRHARSHRRLALLRQFLTLEAFLAVTEGMLRALATDGVPRIGPAFAIALATAAVAWPLERAALAQRDTARRLAERAEATR